jgi:hypothetical protein
MTDPRSPDEPAEAPNGTPELADDQVDEQELESFPASDPHSDWAGPPS